MEEFVFEFLCFREWEYIYLKIYIRNYDISKFGIRFSTILYSSLWIFKNWNTFFASHVFAIKIFRELEYKFSKFRILKSKKLITRIHFSQIAYSHFKILQNRNTLFRF